MADEEKRPLKWRATLAFALAGVFVILIMAASWAAESQMAKLEWLPRWAGTLADRDPNIRTAVPFIPLSFLLVNGLWKLGICKALIWSLAVSATCLGLSEFGQVFLPHRTADVRDLMWGGCGILVGSALGVVSAKCRVISDQ